MIRITRNQTPAFDSEVKAMPLHTPVHADVLAAYPARYFSAWSQRDIEAAWQGFPDLAFTAVGEPLVDAKTGRVAHEWRMTGTHTGEGFPPGVPATNKPFDVAGTDVWQVDQDGRAVSVRAYYDLSTLLGQLGLA
jgi:hypothetical protein